MFLNDTFGWRARLEYQEVVRERSFFEKLMDFIRYYWKN